MEPVNILDARNNLSGLVKRAEAGESIVIAKRGKPVVQLVAVEQTSPHSAESAAVWLTNHHVPAPGRRSSAELDAQIAQERDGWE